jgi:hypothetical protein
MRLMAPSLSRKWRSIRAKIGGHGRGVRVLWVEGEFDGGFVGDGEVVEASGEAF